MQQLIVCSYLLLLRVLNKNSWKNRVASRYFTIIRTLFGQSKNHLYSIKLKLWTVNLKFGIYYQQLIYTLETSKETKQLQIRNIIPMSTSLIPRKLLRIDHGLLRDAQKTHISKLKPARSKRSGLIFGVRLTLQRLPVDTCTISSVFVPKLMSPNHERLRTLTKSRIFRLLI